MASKAKALFYKKAIKALGLSQAKAAGFLGFSPRQSRRIAGGHADLGLPEEKLLKVMLHTGLTVDAVNKICETDAPVKVSKKKTKEAAATV